MIDNSLVKLIQTKLLDWYSDHKRELPWRASRDAYRIWLSEIILQQTRVDQGMQYYLKFIDHYPTVSGLAKASEDEVLKDWQGLGYYSRARNLRKTAKLIVSDYNEQFPQSFDELLKLPGVGPYTAAAISSIAFNEKKGVVDGNVFRLFSRLFLIDDPIDTGKGRKTFQTIADQFAQTNHPGDINQAVMELGATICTPNKPKCDHCPLSSNCLSLQANDYSRPYKQGKTKVKNVHINYLYFEASDYTYIKKRASTGLWAGLFELPAVESEVELEFDAVINSELYQRFDPSANGTLEGVHSVTHLLSHRKVHAKFWRFKLNSEVEEPIAPYHRIKTNEKDTFAVSRLTELFWEKLEES